MTTPLQLTVTAGLLQNQGLSANTQMVANVNAYENFANGVLRSIRIGSGNGNANNAVVSNTTLSRLRSIGAGVCQGLADGIPPGYSLVASNTAPGLTGLLRVGYATVLPANLNFFCQGFDQATGFAQITNQTITTAQNSQTYLGPTFTDMNNLVTGSLSAVTSNLQQFASDAARLGTVIALDALPELGSPAQLMIQLIDAGGIPDGVTTQLTAQGVLQQAQTLVVPDTVVSDTDQTKIYTAMQNVIGEDLVNVLEILDCTVPGLVSMADLLNPVKIFPNSFQTLTCPLPAASQSIYVNSSGSVNTNILPEMPEYLVDPVSPGMPFGRLRLIIPEDQALANKALQLALQQIKGVENLTFAELGRTAGALEINTDLPLINDLQQAVPPAVANLVLQSVAQGTGPNGQLTVSDVLGTASGYNITQPLGNVMSIITTIPTNYLELTYDVMGNLISGDYGNVAGNIDIPAGFPGAGLYDNGNDAYANLCNIANSTISNLAAAYPTQIASVNTDWNTIANTVSNQQTNLVAGTVDYANMVSTQTAVFSFASSLSQYGLDVQPGGASQYLTSVAQVNNIYGQAIVAALREARNQKTLEDNQLTPDNQIPN